MGRLGTESAFEVLARAKAMEAAGSKVIHLEIGEPDFPTADHIVNAAIDALRAGQTHYVPAPGIPPLREAVAAFLDRTGRMPGISPDRVVVTPGAKPIMFFTILALCNEGDEVLYPDPGFPMYESITSFAGATPVPIPLRESNGFRVDVEELKSLISERTRLLVLNSPHNPCGSALTAGDCAAIAEIALERDLIVLSDEVYWALRYSQGGSGGMASPQKEAKHASVLDVPGMADRTILLDGWSKTFAMTGWRLGFGVFPPALVEPVTRLAINSVSCTSAFSQYAAIVALTGPWDPVADMVAEFGRRRDVIVAGLNDIPGITCVEPGGAFYAFPNITGTGLTSAVLADRLLTEAGVAALSGTAFGRHGEGYLRFSYANSVENIEAALEAIRGVLLVTARVPDGGRRGRLVVRCGFVLVPGCAAGLVPGGWVRAVVRLSRPIRYAAAAAVPVAAMAIAAITAPTRGPGRRLAAFGFGRPRPGGGAGAGESRHTAAGRSTASMAACRIASARSSAVGRPAGSLLRQAQIAAHIRSGTPGGRCAACRRWACMTAAT